MTDRNEATRQIQQFLGSDDMFLLLTGTHQQEKHRLALRLVLAESPLKILFRTNHASHYEEFLQPVLRFRKKPRPGIPIRVSGGHTLYVDTMNSASWKSAPTSLDVALLYPIDSYSTDQGTRSVENVLRLGAKKILLITWTDNRDYSWTNQYSPIHVVYDAEAEDPAYHQRVKDLTTAPRGERLPRLPKYAEHVPHEYLVRVRCPHCGSVWARMNERYPGEIALTQAPMGKYHATCLKCDEIVDDSHKWHR